MVKRGVPTPAGFVPKSQGRLYIEEHMKAHGMTRADLAAELDTTEASVSRWINANRGVKQRRRDQLEELFHLPPGGLAWPPSKAPKESLLAGLSEEKQRQALIYIEFLRSQD